MAETERVLTEDHGPVRRLVLNEAKRRNALSSPMIADLRAALDSAVADPAVRVIIIAANGPAFSAGHDLKEINQGQTTGTGELVSLFKDCNALMLAIAQAQKPIIAEVDGIATAAGCQLVAQCDLAVASDTSRFATPGAGIGLFCSTPSVPLTRAVSSKAAMEMLLTADPIPAPQALAIGLVNRIVPEDELGAATLALANRICEHPPEVLALGKRTVRAHANQPLEAAYEIAGQAMVDNLAFEAAKEGISAFIDKRDPSWKPA